MLNAVRYPDLVLFNWRIPDILQIVIFGRIPDAGSDIRASLIETYYRLINGKQHNKISIPPFVPTLKGNCVSNNHIDTYTSKSHAIN